ncbi:hypothetical protein BJX65DRAFT_322048 [Aspergillus insuetus]
MLSCDYPGCTAQYRRKEHLTRHAKKHDDSSQLACEHCEKTFERSDTLRRHQQLHLREEADSTPRAAKACDRCHANKTRCDGRQPCDVCSRRGLFCTFNRRSKRSAKEPVTTTDIAGSSSSVSESQGSSYGDSLPFVDFDSPDALSLPDHSAIQQSIIRQHEEEIRQNRILGPAGSAAQTSVNQNQYPAEKSSSDLDIDYNVEVYFAHFHAQWPFLHKPSFVRSKDCGPKVLLLTVVMIGLWVTGDLSSRERAETMHGKLVALLESRIGDWKSQKEFKDRAWPLATFQAILLNIIFSTIREATSSLQDRCSSLLRALTTTCIAGGLFSHERMRAQIQPSDSMLFAWTYVEETQRLALALFKVNTLFQTGMLRVEDLEFPLPENGYLWDAPETRDFYSRYHAQLESGAYARDPPLICDIFRDVEGGRRGLGLLSLERCLQQLFEITGRHTRHCHHISELDIYAQLETLRAILCQLDPTLTLPPGLVSDIDKVLTHRSNHSLLTPSSSILPRITITHGATSGTQTQKQKQTRISLWKGDITTLTGVSAIVNAANSQLLGCFRPSHRCIDNVIHSAAGPRLRRACYELMQEENQGYEEPSGSAKVTPGFNLHARYVIHTVGPELDGGREPDEDDRRVLKDCYVSCLEAAEVLEPLEDGRKVLVFCCISTGLFAFPSDVAARIALVTVVEWCLEHPETTITDVIFDMFLQRDWELYNVNIPALPIQQTDSSASAVTIHSSPAEPPHPLIPESIHKARSWPRSADYLIISAGAGLSAATGLDYTSPTLFAKHFPAFLPLGLRRLYDVFGFDGWESPEQKWGYYFHHLDMVRNWPQSPLYGSLRTIAEGFGSRCFVRTSNADGFFVLNGFHPSRISTPQGQYAFLQCFAKCRREAVFPSAPFVDAALPFLNPETQCLTDSSKIPVCKYCGGELAICVRGGDYFNSSPFKAQEREYKRFIEHVSNTIDTSLAEADGGASPKAVILELGVGMNTPSVLRWANDELLEESASRGFRLIRAGLDAAGCAPWGLEEQGLAVGINGDLNEVVRMLGETCM